MCGTAAAYIGMRLLGNRNALLNSPKALDELTIQAGVPFLCLFFFFFATGVLPFALPAGCQAGCIL